MQVDVLIIGQGICGTMLSWWLEKAGMSYVVADDPKPDSASRVAAGVINPVTGRRMVKTWMESMRTWGKNSVESLFPC